MSAQIQVRRDTAVNWDNVNPTLADGEIGLDKTSNKFKVGNGVSAWKSLDYSAGAPVTEVGGTAPNNPQEGQMWLNSDDGYLYVYYENAGNPTWMAVERQS